MKRYFFFIGILFCSAFAVAHPPTLNNSAFQPSNNENRSVFFGLSFGPTIDWFAPTIDELTRKKAKGGVIGGINVDVSLTKSRMLYFSTGLHFRYLQGELLLTHQYEFVGMIDSVLALDAVRTYQTMYLTIPTGIKFRTTPSRGCVFMGKLGLYHNFKVGGDQFDSFTLPGVPEKYNVTTNKEKNNDAALFAESGYIGLGFEYVFKNSTRVFANVDYSCQFNYFSSTAKSNVTDARFRTIIHSLHIVFGFMF
jgi:hypothetical protein